MRNTLTFALAALVSATAWAQEDTAYVAFSALDDGSCPGRSSLESLAVGYSHESENRSANAYVRQAPSGGNCEVDGQTISMDVEQRFEVGFGNLDGLLKLSYDSRSVSAVYGTADLRADGTPAFAAGLAAGRAESVGVILGVSLSGNGYNIDGGLNPLNVDWANGEQGGTIHFGFSSNTDLGFAELETMFSLDTGEDTFGDAEIAIIKDFPDSPLSMRAGYRYGWGLTALDAGVPGSYEYQSFSGANALLLQGTEDTRGEFTIGIEFAL